MPRPERFGRGRSAQHRTPVGLPPDYLSQGYFDASGQMHEELYTSTAEKVAQLLARADMKVAALRRFFAKVRGIEATLRSSGNFQDVKGDIVSLERDATYAAGRKVGGRSIAPEVFRDFIIKNVEQAKKAEQEFKAFLEHFQSVVAYFTYHTKERRTAR